MIQMDFCTDCPKCGNGTITEKHGKWYTFDKINVCLMPGCGYDSSKTIDKIREEKLKKLGI